jgi:hypothetical protein
MMELATEESQMAQRCLDVRPSQKSLVVAGQKLRSDWPGIFRNVPKPLEQGDREFGHGRRYTGY